jgi:hypothetical protein
MYCTWSSKHYTTENVYLSKRLPDDMENRCCLKNRHRKAGLHVLVQYCTYLLYCSALWTKVRWVSNTNVCFALSFKLIEKKKCTARISCCQFCNNPIWKIYRNNELSKKYRLHRSGITYILAFRVFLSFAYGLCWLHLGHCCFIPRENSL